MVEISRPTLTEIEIKERTKKQIEKDKITFNKIEKKEIEKHKQTKTKKIKKQKIVGAQRYINATTGEEIETLVIEKNIEQDFNFFKVWLMDLFNVLELVGTKKMKVVNYILDNLDTKNNMIIATHTEIAKATGISRVVVSQTFKILLEVEFLVKKQNGVYMLNPGIIAKGDTNKRLNLLVKFNEIKSSKN